MENASKALIMAASVLLGVMILSIGVYLFYVYGNYSAEAYQRMEDNQIAEFNAQFLKYYGNTKRSYVDENGNVQEVQGPILCTIQDIMSLANLAAKNNIQYEVNDQARYDENTQYIQIDIGTNRDTQNIEKWNNDQKIECIQENSTKLQNKLDANGRVELDENGNPIQETVIKNYICTDARISEVTKRIYYMRFVEYEE